MYRYVRTVVIKIVCSQHYAHVKGNLTVLLEYIDLYQKIFNMVTVLLEYIKFYTYNYNECSIRVYRSFNIFSQILPIMLALCYYAQNYPNKNSPLRNKTNAYEFNSHLDILFKTIGQSSS